MLEGFKKFIMRGNVLDLAVGVIIASAFSPIVSALTDKVIMPLIGAIFGKPSFDSVGEFTINGALIQPGTIITAVVNFLLIAAALYFCIVLPMNKMAERKAAKAEPVAEEAPVMSDEAKLLMEIRDALAAKN